MKNKKTSKAKVVMSSDNVDLILGALDNNGITVPDEFEFEDDTSTTRTLEFSLAPKTNLDKALAATAKELGHKKTALDHIQGSPLLSLTIGDYLYELDFENAEDETFELKQMDAVVDDGLGDDDLADLTDGGFIGKGLDDDGDALGESEEEEEVVALPEITVKQIRTQLKKLGPVMEAKPGDEDDYEISVEDGTTKKDFIAMIELVAEALDTNTVEEEGYTTAIEHSDGVYAFLFKIKSREPVVTMFALEAATEEEPAEEEEEEEEEIVVVKPRRGKPEATPAPAKEVVKAGRTKPEAKFVGKVQKAEVGAEVEVELVLTDGERKALELTKKQLLAQVKAIDIALAAE